MKSIVTEGLICVKDFLNIEYVVAKITHLVNEDETFKYIFTPYYDVIDLLDTKTFQGIPGLNLDLKREQYIRDNILPVFISERVPSERREDFYELLEDVGMEYMNPIEYLTKTKLKYSGDNFYVKRYQDRKTIFLEENIKKSNCFGIIKIILDNIAQGNEVFIENKTKINSKETFRLLRMIYKVGAEEISNKQKEGIEIAKSKGVYKGRKPIKVDYLAFLDEYEKVKNGEITAKQAAKNLGISIDKYYRFKKKINIDN